MYVFILALSDTFNCLEYCRFYMSTLINGILLCITLHYFGESIKSLKCF